MGRFPLVTLRALAEHDRVKAMMRAPLRGTGLGVPSFGISHFDIASSGRARALAARVRYAATRLMGVAAYWFNRLFSTASLGSSHSATH